MRPLATCSYTGYRLEMGTPVKISLGAPRWVKLPDPRFGNREHWIYFAELAPRREYFHSPGPVFDRMYVAQLERFAEGIEKKIEQIPAEYGRLVLLCFEKKVRGPQDCHRRVFAEWWTARTGQEVPELGGGR